MELKFQVYAKIAKPVAEVFDAVYDPRKLSAYFTTGGPVPRSTRAPPSRGTSPTSRARSPCTCGKPSPDG
jgi:uncharacterized protein YndB with AHSA1/START domain